MSLEENLNRLITEVTAARSKAEVRVLLFVNQDLLGGLSPRTHEQIMTVLQDIIAELPEYSTPVHRAPPPS